MSMDAIIPLMPEPGHVVTRPMAAGALTRLFEAVRSATSLGRVLAVGQDKNLLALAEQSGLSAVLLAAPVSLRPAGLLPAGGVEALERMAADDRRTLLISCANPLLTSDVIDAFAHQAENAGRPTVSVLAPADHPCQLSQHLRMHEAGVLLPLDRMAADGGPRLLTRPFRFAWTAQQVRGQGPFFVLAPTQGEPLLLSVPDHAPLPACGPLLVRESGDSARLSLPAEEVRELAALFGVRAGADIVCIGLHLSPGLPSLAFRDSQGALVLGFAASPRRRSLCHLYAPAGQNAGSAERHAALHLYGTPPRAALPWNFPEPGTTLSYTLLEHLDDDGGFDTDLAFPEDHGLWRMDPATGCRVNAGSGRVIHGRQEFPEVFEPDGSLFALTRAEAGRFEELLYAGETAAFVLERGQSLRLCSEFDLLRYRAKLRAEAI